MAGTRQGTVVADLLIGTDGTPKSCTIIKSSNHQVLDDTTCTLLVTRAKFAPTIDKKTGRPIEDHYPDAARHLATGTVV